MTEWKPYRPELDRLAQTWSQAGVSGFALFHADRAVFGYPTPLPTGTPDHTAVLPGFPSFKLALWGCLEPSQVDQLEAQAVLLAALLRQEHELDSVTAALVERQDQLLTFYELNRELRPHLKLDESLLSIADAARQMLQVSGACILFVEGKEVRQAISAAYEPSQELESAALNTLVTGTPVQFEATFCIPLRIRHEFRAVLLWQGRWFDSPDIKLMYAVAEQAAAHLETVVFYNETLARERLEREMELARQVQSYLLPHKAPHVDGLDMYAASIPALSVGGDFYDFLTCYDGRRLFVVGDVSGKGVPAAMIMAMTRSALRCAARALRLASPSEIINYLSAELYDDFTDIGVFVTLFIANFHPRAYTITVANAGHSPVLYYGDDALPRMLEADGVPIGTLPSNFCEDQRLAFTPGSALLIGTDGFPEALAPSGDMFGYDRLLQLAHATQSMSAAAAAAEFFGAVRCYRDKRSQDDDQTLMIIKRTTLE